MNHVASLMLFLVLLQHPEPAIASPIVPEESRLDVYTHGFKVGEIITRNILRQVNGHDEVHFTGTTRINADFVVTSYRLEGEEEARIGPEGTLSYRKVWRENDVQYQADGRLEGKTFHCVNAAPEREPRSHTLPRESYDFTTMDCPELRIKGEGESLTVRLLDLETCEVVTRIYRWVRTERLRVNGVADLYRVIEFHDRNKSGTRWIFPSPLGVRIARQDGTTRKGSYSVRASSVAR